MKLFNNLKISARLVMQFAIIYIFAVVVGALGFFGVMNSKGSGSAVLFLAAVAVISIAAMLLIARLVSSSVSKPLERVTELVERLAAGDTDIDMKADAEDEIGVLKSALGRVANNIRTIAEDSGRIYDAAKQNNLDVRADESRYSGDFKKMINGMNKTLDAVTDRISWYEAITDAVPFPIHVTDNEMNWTYMNKAFEKLMIEQGVVKDRKSGYGRACSNAGANICNTQNCGIKQLLKGNAESYFDWCGMSCKQDTSYLKNKKGESMGFVEVVTDLTSILRVNEYSKGEVERLAGNLNLLAQGNLDMDLNVKEADTHTAETRKNFEMINENLKKVKSSLNLMINDTEMLVSAAVDGKLETRADASKHQGDFKKIVEGVNATLDAMTTPLAEAKGVLEKMAHNDYTLSMTGQYRGAFKEFTEAINLVLTRVLSIQDALVKAGKGDVSRLDEFRKIGRRSENDLIMPSMTNTLEAIKNLIDEAGMLSAAAVAGDLSARGNTDKFHGGYKEIIEGMNRTMDAIVRPIKEASAVMEEMAKGNLTVTMDGDYQGEYAKIKHALNMAIESFNEVLDDINDAATQVAAGARQVSDSAQALSQGSTEQASSIEELTATMEEIASQTKQNAVNASEASHLALLSKEDAIKGNDQMKEMLKAMGDINEASTNISKIIKVIDEIAFQTNILALNAAVEAARAGQHGKGFAVVAEEVRNLAARSANAAKETTVLIEGTIKKVEGGTKIANDTASALDKIVEGVTKASALVGDIAVASNEQATGISQVNQGIMQVSDVTQTNSATSEESAAASEELSSQSEILKEQVARFRLKKFQKSISSYRELEGLTPDMIDMLEQLNARKKQTPMNEARSQTGVTGSKKIVLSDKEFGKY